MQEKERAPGRTVARLTVVAMLASTLMAIGAQPVAAGDIVIGPADGTGSCGQIQYHQPYGQYFTAEDPVIEWVGLWVNDVNDGLGPGDYEVEYRLYEGIGTGGPLMRSQQVGGLSDGYSDYLDMYVGDLAFVPGNAYTLVALQENPRWSLCGVGGDVYAGGYEIVYGGPTPFADLYFRALVPGYEEPIVGDHYLTYQVKRTDNSPRFRPARVYLGDQFGEGIYKVTRPRDLGLPVSKNEEPVLDPVTHYMVYDVKPVDITLDEMPVVEVSNQFGSWWVQVRRPERLMTPALKFFDGDDGEVPRQPVNGEGVLANHYLCYSVRVLDGPPDRFKVYLDDQFPEPPRLFEVRGLQWLCAPAEKIHDDHVYPVVDPELHLACYGAFPMEIRHRHLFGIPVLDQFGEWLFNTKRERELCVPTAKFLDGEEPPPPVD